MSALEALAALLSLGGVYLGAHRRLAAWPVALIASLFYGEVFLRAKLYSDALLQVLFCLFALYGWARWRPHLDAAQQVRPARLPRMPMWRDLALGAAGALLLGALMRYRSDAALPWLDAALTAASLVAQAWQARRHAAAWPLWMAVDTVYVGEYAYKSLMLTACLYALFVLLAGAGWRRWRRAAG